MRSLPDLVEIEDSIKLFGTKLDKLQSEMEGLNERMDDVEDRIDDLHEAGMHPEIEYLERKIRCLDQEIRELRGLLPISNEADGFAARVDGQGA